jgi:hypothetical protein
MESNFVDVAQIAKVCHEAARAHEQTLGNKGTKSWEEIEQIERDQVMQAVLEHLNNPATDFGTRIAPALFANIVRAFSGGRSLVLPFREIPAPPMMSIKAGEKNDPSVAIGCGASAGVTQEYLDGMAVLGFKEAEGSFVYNANGRAIWVNPTSPSPSEDITRQIVEQAEAIGARRKINEIRQALDLPFEVVATIEQPKPTEA